MAHFVLLYHQEATHSLKFYITLLMSLFTEILFEQ